MKNRLWIYGLLAVLVITGMCYIFIEKTHITGRAIGEYDYNNSYDDTSVYNTNITTTTYINDPEEAQDDIDRILNYPCMIDIKRILKKQGTLYIIRKILLDYDPTFDPDATEQRVTDILDMYAKDMSQSERLFIANVAHLVWMELQSGRDDSVYTQYDDPKAQTQIINMDISEKLEAVKIKRPVQAQWSLEDFTAEQVFSYLVNMKFYSLRRFNTFNTMVMDISLDLIPCPPIIFGRLVTRRSIYSETTTEPEEEPGDEEEPADVGPLGMVYGVEAGEIYLDPGNLFHRAEIVWDYSHIPGCEKVMLQISDGDGFRNPGSRDAWTDEGVFASYIGPVRIERLEPPGSPDDLFMPNEHISFATSELRLASFNPLDLDLERGNPGNYYGHDWRQVQVRLVALDADENQLDLPATDHVTVYKPIAYPEIVCLDYSVRWVWGEQPQRIINFVIECRSRYNPLAGDPNDFRGPVSLLVGTPSWAHGHSNYVRNISLRVGTEYTESQMDFRGDPRYIVEIEDWTYGQRLTMQLTQEFVSLNSSRSLEIFTCPRLSVLCVPGIHYSWSFYTDPALKIDYCAYRSYVAGFRNDYYDQVYDWIISTFRGTRTSSVSGVENVMINFELGDVTNSEELINLMRINRPIVMREETDTTTRRYTFRWGGMTASMRRHSDRAEYHGDSGRSVPGDVILGIPDTLQMHFVNHHSYIDESSGMWMEENVDYDLERIR